MLDEDDDMVNTVAPKSEQLQADDLIGGRSITIKINRREIKKGIDQPLSLFYDGDNGKPYKPSKGMRHVLIGLFGKSSKNYIGKSLTLYRDEKVKFGPDTTGGVRISNSSHITEPVTIIIPVSRGIRKPFTVKPLIIAEPAPAQIDHTLEILKRNARDNAINGTSALQTWWGTMPKESQAKLKPFMDEYKKIASENEPKKETTNEGVTA